MCGELQVLFVLFLTLLCSHPVLAHPVFRPMQQQPGLSAVAGPFVKARLPQPGEDGKFFVVAVFLPRCFAHALPVPFSSH